MKGETQQYDQINTPNCPGETQPALILNLMEMPTEPPTLDRMWRGCPQCQSMALRWSLWRGSVSQFTKHAGFITQIATEVYTRLHSYVFIPHKLTGKKQAYLPKYLLISCVVQNGGWAHWFLTELKHHQVKSRMKYWMRMFPSRWWGKAIYRKDAELHRGFIVTNALSGCPVLASLLSWCLPPFRMGVKIQGNIPAAGAPGKQWMGITVPKTEMDSSAQDLFRILILPQLGKTWSLSWDGQLLWEVRWQSTKFQCIWLLLLEPPLKCLMFQCHNTKCSQFRQKQDQTLCFKGKCTDTVLHLYDFSMNILLLGFDY